MRRGLGLLAFVLGVGFGASLASCGGDSGSAVTIEPRGDDCDVTLRRNQDGFDVEMTLACSGGGIDCHRVTALSCNGVAKTDEVPLDLENDDDACPGAAYCIADCSEGLDAPGSLWDMPSLLAVDGCNVYEDDA